MGTTQTKARYGGTSTEDEGKTEEATNDESDEDEELYCPFGLLLLLQLIHDLLPNSMVRHQCSLRIQKHPLETEEPPVHLGDWRFRDFATMFQHDLVPYLRRNLYDLPPPLQEYLSKPLRSWKRFLQTNLQANENDLSRFVTLFAREHVKREFYADLRYLRDALIRGPEVQIAMAAHGPGQRCVKCAVAAAWFDRNCEDDGLVRHLLPRFYLLQALCDKLPILTSTYETSAQYRMSREISGFFALILDAASAGEVMYVSEVVDRFLVPYLQSQSQLAKSLRDYLPKRHQSWKYFLDRMEFNDEEKVLFALNCDPLPEDSPRLLEACESLIKDFNSKYLAKVVSEIRGMETDDVFRVPERHTEVDVFYATDRHVTEDGEYIGQHSAMSDWRKGKELHYGITTVGIPDEGGRSRRQESPLKHVEILSVDTTLQHEHLRFVDEINNKLLAQEASAGEVLLYIHGYNVNHRDAIKQAAQLKHDLKFKGLVIVYSWPSNGTLWGYKHDEKVIEESAPWVHQFITTLLTEVKEVKKVHILAHDMGNRALIEALHDSPCRDSSSLVKGDTSHSSNRQNIVQLDVKGALENVIFLAPDAMRARFEEMDLNNMCNWRTQELPPFLFTIYLSAADRKLFLSWRLHEQNQLVDTQSLVQMENCGEYSRFTWPIAVDDTSEVDSNMSPQHSYTSLDHKFLHDDIAGDIQNLLSSNWKLKEESTEQEEIEATPTREIKPSPNYKPYLYDVALG